MQIKVCNFNVETCKSVSLENFSYQYYSSNYTDFLNEAKKYECPIRFVKFLAEHKSKFELIYKDYFIPNFDDIELDFSKRQTEYSCDIYYDLIIEGKFDLFIEKTPEYNRYGKVGF